MDMCYTDSNRIPLRASKMKTLSNDHWKDQGKTEEGNSGYRYKRNVYGRIRKNGEFVISLPAVVETLIDDVDNFINYMGYSYHN
jgi:hypothetical protein